MNRRLRFSAWLTLVFLAGTGCVAWHHELWRDEMQAWLIARDSPNLLSLCLQGRYDGTPPLWYLLLRPLTFVTHRPEAMQLLTWGLAGLTFFIACHFAPLSRAQRILLLFNYYLFYEYGTVCRQYLLGVLALFVACLLFPSAGKRPWAFAMALVAAALTSVYALILAVAMATAFWGAAIADYRRAAPEGRRKAFAGIHLPVFLALGIGIALAVGAMWPEPDAYYGPAFGWHFGWDGANLARVACAFTNALCFLPRPTGFFWIPAWQTEFTLGHDLAAWLSLPLLGATLWLLRRSIQAIAFYAISVLGLTVFLYTKYLGFTRHVGFLFIAFLLALWLERQLTANQPALAGSVSGNRAAGIALTGVLAIQAVTGVWAARADFAGNFSCGEAAARELTARHLEKACIAAWPDYVGVDMAGYLDRSIYYPQSHRWGSFTRWDQRSSQPMSDAEALNLAVSEAGPTPLVIVLNHELTPELLAAHGLMAFGFFQGSLVPFEDYIIYFRPQAGQSIVPAPIRLTGGASSVRIQKIGGAL